MKIGLLHKGEDSFANQRLKEEAEKLGIEFLFYNKDKFEIITSKSTANIFYEGQQIDLPDVLYPRLGAGVNYFELAIIRQFESLGVFVLNSSKSIELAKDKMQTLQVLSSIHLPIPKTILAKNTLDLDFIEKELNFPLVLKKISGSQGKGVILCEDKNKLEDISNLVSGNNLNIILQEFVSKSFGKDIRVFVIGGKVLGAMLRKSTNGNFKANFSLGGEVENFPLNKEIEYLAVESAKAVGLEIAGVDILFDGESYKICEVNSNPGFEGFEQATGINVAQEILNFLKIRLGI